MKRRVDEERGGGERKSVKRLVDKERGGGGARKKGGEGIKREKV